MPTPIIDPFDIDASGERRPLRVPWRRARMALGVGIVVVLLAAAGCGGDDDDAAGDKGTETGGNEQASTTTTTGAGEADTAAYCEAAVPVAIRPDPDIDPVNMSDEQLTEVVTTWASDTLQPLVAQLEPTVPDELKDAFTTLNDALQRLIAGDVSAVDSPEVDAANDAFSAYSVEHCGWNSQSVTATEYSFTGIPTTLPAGVTRFELTNDGTEVHELVLLRKNDGVTQSFEQILALPEDQAMQMVTELDQTAGPLDPGDDDRVTVDLTPGDYLALCFIPTGTTSVDAPAEGPPHFTQGMVSELTVT